jgi:hypothetical protein
MFSQSVHDLTCENMKKGYELGTDESTTVDNCTLCADFGNKVAAKILLGSR